MVNDTHHISDNCESMSGPQANPKAIITRENCRFTVLTDRLLRYEWSFDGKFEDRASTFAINRNFSVPEFRVNDSADELAIVTDCMLINYDKKKFSPNGFTVTFNGKISLWGAQWRYGIEHAGNDLGGTARTLDEIDGRCDMGTGVISRSGYAAVDDSNSMLFDGKGFAVGRSPGDRIDGYLFCYGHDYRGALEAFYAISGNQPLLPRWALGNWWSRYYPYADVEYVTLMDEFKKQDIPLSVAVIDMDWHLTGDDERVPHSGWTGYTWNDKLFPNPKQFGEELHKRNLKITLNDHPHGGVHYHEDAYEEMAKALGHDTSKKAPILFDFTNKAFVHAFFNILHRRVENDACDFWWIDWQQGSYSKVFGLDPLWLLNHFHFLDNAKVSKQALIFSRYAGPGSHRYPVGFSGDTVTTWASLEFQPEFTATASNIGYGWWSHDIGGHFHGSRDDELVTRWVQFGVFSPIMRLHSSNSQWCSKEPWRYRKESQEIMQHYMQLRHRMMPYTYTMNILSTSGLPLVQPMYWSFPAHEEAYRVPNQYLFGNQLVVAPIVKPRDKRTNLGMTKTWIPPHRHVDIFTGVVYDGDREMNMYRTLQEMPVLAAEGSIIPLDAALAPQNGGFNPEGFEVLVVVGKDCQFDIVEDATDDYGQTTNLQSNPRKSTIDYSQASGTLTATMSGSRPLSLSFISIIDVPSSLKVLVNGAEVPGDIEVRKYPQTPSLLVRCQHLPDNENNTITIELGPTPQLNVLHHTERVRDMMLDYQTDFDQKDLIWNAFNHKGHVNIKMSKLMSLGIDEALAGPIAELILADSRIA